MEVSFDDRLIGILGRFVDVISCIGRLVDRVLAVSDVSPSFRNRAVDIMSKSFDVVKSFENILSDVVLGSSDVVAWFVDILVSVLSAWPNVNVVGSPSDVTEEVGSFVNAMRGELSVVLDSGTFIG